ncbi:unnamed protein product [Didymodactylos carnosus]|uniref:Uncharacterized protein n=1 Tax=Didymodactylos carnosus TaxID=1234261 RepID=A0A814JSY7_9BILA|nr:unnamed protein product [Didymodactylos carnosus]CAF3812341.1 unnamed protein product [Didymodactylos carnosus]
MIAVANPVSLADTGNAIVEELNQTRHSMAILQDRLVYFYNHMKTLQNVVNIVAQQSIPTIENEIYYDKIHQSLDDLINGKKNFDYLSRDELHQLVNTLFQRSSKILALFDMALMTLINRLIASESFYFVLNTDNGTNGNNPKAPNVSDDTYCVMATEQNDEPTQINGVNIKSFAIIKLPCKSTLNCKHQISLRNTNCQSSIDYYLASGGHYSKNNKLLELLNMDTFNDSMLLGFVNDANQINMISKNISKIQRDQKDIQLEIEQNILRLPSISKKFGVSSFLLILIIGVLIINILLIILYVKYCLKKLYVNVPVM